jgi:hypothetical protein
MADSEVTTIPLHLLRAGATALARLADCARLAAPCTTYGDRPEADVMWSGLLTLQGALAFAGFKL